MENYFALLGLEPAFTFDQRRLEQAYQLAIAACHPDRHAGDPLLARQAQQISSQLNLAYATLANPIERARHLLELAGHSHNPAATSKDMEFLQHQMQWRERLEQGLSPNQIEQLRGEYQLCLEALQEGFARQFDTARLDELITRLQYWSKLCQGLPG